MLFRSNASSPPQLAVAAAAAGGTVEQRNATSQPQLAVPAEAVEQRNASSPPQPVVQAAAASGTVEQRNASTPPQPVVDKKKDREEVPAAAAGGVVEQSRASTPPQAVASSALSDCVDMLGWTDSEGGSCVLYASKRLCTRNGDYGSGWTMKSKTFLSLSSRGQTALSACCACGGGQGEVPCSDSPAATTVPQIGRAHV